MVTAQGPRLGGGGSLKRKFVIYVYCQLMPNVMLLGAHSALSPLADIIVAQCQTVSQPIGRQYHSPLADSTLAQMPKIPEDDFRVRMGKTSLTLIQQG